MNWYEIKIEGKKGLVGLEVSDVGQFENIALAFTYACDVCEQLGCAEIISIRKLEESELNTEADTVEFEDGQNRLDFFEQIEKDIEELGLGDGPSDEQVEEYWQAQADRGSSEVCFEIDALFQKNGWCK